MVGHIAHFTAFLSGIGYHESAWRLAAPADLAGPARFGVLECAALTAERGLLDAVFFADSPGPEIFRGGTSRKWASTCWRSSPCCRG